MKKIKQRFKSYFIGSSFKKNVVLVSGGTALAQIITVLLTPIITRIYSPGDFGVLTSFTSIITIFAVFTAFDYHKAIPLEKNENNVKIIIRLSVYLLLSFVLILTIFTFLFGNNILIAINSNDLTSYSYLIVLIVLFMGLNYIFLQWALRYKYFKFLSFNKLQQSVTSNALKLIFGILSFGAIGLLLGYTFSFVVAGTTLVIFYFTRHGNSEEEVEECSSVKELAIKYKNFPIYSAPSNIIYTVTERVPAIILLMLFTTSTVGYFGLTISTLSIPVSLISISFSQVYYADIAKMGNDKPQMIYNLSKKIIIQLAPIAFLMALVLILFGPWAFSFVYGKEWYISGVYARYLAIMLFLHFIVLPFGRVFEVFEEQYMSLIINLFRLLLILAGFIIAFILDLSDKNTVILYSIASSISYITLFLAVYIRLKIRIKKVEA